MNIISFDDIITMSKKENMVDIWIEFENNNLYTHRTYGFDGEQYYSLGDRYWNPLYVKTYENFIDFVKRESVFYDGSCLLKIKRELNEHS